MADTDLAFLPDSFFAGDSINVTFNIKGSMYYKITEPNAKLYSRDELGIYVAESDLEVGTQLVAKAFLNNEPYIYAVILSGPSKLDQGFVKLQSLGNIEPNFVNPDFVPTQAKKLGKIDLEVFSNDTPIILYKDLKGNADESFITNVPTKSPPVAPLPANRFQVFDTYKDKNNEKWLGLNTKPNSIKYGGKRIAEMPDGTVVEKIKEVNSKWWQVEVVSGKDTGKVGYSHSRWLKNIAPEDQYEVYNTATDTKAPYLALRKGPSKKYSLKFEMKDGTRVEKLAQKKGWWKVKLLGTNTVGWAFSSYLRPISQAAAAASIPVKGALLNTTPLSLVSKVKTDANFLKVKVLAGTGTGKIGYIENAQTREPETPFPDELKDVALPLKESLSSLNDKFVKIAVKQKTGLNNFNIKDPSSAGLVFEKLREYTLTNISLMAKTNITYYNPATDSVDIIQPFYFSPENQTSHLQVIKELEGEGLENAVYYLEPYARAIAALNAGVVEPFSTISVEQEAKGAVEDNLAGVYKKSNGANINAETLGRQLLSVPSILSKIVKNASDFMKLTEDVFYAALSDEEELAKIQVIASPALVQTPRWGFFTYRIAYENFKNLFAQPVLTQQGVNHLVAAQGEPYGADIIHGFLSEIPAILEPDNIIKLSIRISDLESRLLGLRIKALDFDDELKKGNIQIFRGATEDESVPQKTVYKQYQNLNKFPTFVRTALVDGTVTKDVTDTLSNTAVNITFNKRKQNLKKGETENQIQEVTSITMLNTEVGGNNSPTSYQVPTLETTRNFGNENVSIPLNNGKLSLLEEKVADKIDEVLSSIDFNDFEKTVVEIEELLQSKKNKETSDADFLAAIPEKGAKYYMIYSLANVVRSAVADRAVNLGSVPTNLKRNKKIKTGKKFTYQVFNTASDIKDPGLHLRSKPGSKKGTDHGLLVDGDQVTKLGSKKATGGLWFKVKVLTGKLEGKTGWSNSKWLKKIPPYKMVSLQDFNTLSGPYVLGNDQSDKPITYKPDFLQILKQLRWINFDQQNKATLDYNFLLIKKYSSKSYPNVSGYNTEEFSFILSLTKDRFDEIRKYENYKDFFDNIYKHRVFYKEGEPTSAQENLKDKNDSPTTIGDALSLTLSQEEKKQILNQLYSNRHKITEQAFGDSGCLPAAVKLVDTIDDLYDTVLNKADWASLVVMAIDRFKCELSKVGGGGAECLADFDVVGTFDQGKQAVDTIQNFKSQLKGSLMDEAKINLPKPLFNIIFDRKVPSMPQMDWYKCLRAILLSIIYKILTELIVLFVNLILDIAGIECSLDLSKCEASETDPASSDITDKKPDQRGNAAAAGMRNRAETTEKLNKLMQRNFQIDQQFTVERLTEYIRFLVSKMPIANFKALLADDTPIHIFNHGKFLTQNFFAPITFTNEQFREMLDIIDENYDYAAFIAAVLFEQINPDTEICPPELYDGQNLVDQIKDSLQQKIERENGDDSQNTTVGNIESTVQKEIEDRISAFCEVLNFGKGLITEINSGPAQLAGITKEIISGAMTNIVTTLRIKPAYDFEVLKYMFTGDFSGDNPDMNDIITADVSLAFNVLYQNYLIEQVSDEKWQKNYKVYPEIFKGMLGSDYGRLLKILNEDTFVTEFGSDLLNLIPFAMPFLIPFLGDMRAALYDVEKKDGRQFLLAGLGDTEANLVRASRELNNPNYFYAWLEELAAAATSAFGLPAVDPRRFPAKYKDFTEENYPNVVRENKKLQIVGEPYTLKTSYDSSGIHYTFSNNNIVLLRVDVALDECNVSLRNGKVRLERGLPQLSEPFFVDEEQNYLTIIDEYNKLYVKKSATNPQQQIFYSLFEKSLTDVGIDSTQGIFPELAEGSFEFSIDEVRSLVETSFENSKEQVGDFFFQPYFDLASEKAKVQKQVNELLKDDEGDRDWKKILKLLKQTNPKPPVALFFQRSDNVISDVFFEDSVAQETKKIVKKIEGSMASYYKDMTDGKKKDTKKIARAVELSFNDPALFYDAQREISSKRPGWLSDSSFSESTQKQIEEIIERTVSEQ